MDRPGIGCAAFTNDTRCIEQSFQGTRFDGDAAGVSLRDYRVARGFAGLSGPIST